MSGTETLTLSPEELHMLIESLDSVGWNASLRPGTETELGKRARILRVKLTEELLRIRGKA